MHELMQIRIPKGNKDSSFWQYFFHLACRTSVAAQGSETREKPGFGRHLWNCWSKPQ